ncbi:thioredoxin-disulfide reductase [Candidatus Dojkabacteria bacterium]|nr:thioredoxin-disulfide reductase [Candidatus Dojkabacteria bacterium]
MEKLIIIGSGPAGLTAAIYAARADIKPLVFAGEQFGGQLMSTTDIENFPGFPNGIPGPELMMNMIKQAERFGAVIKYQSVTKVELKGKVKKVYSGKEVFEASSVIIATGAVPRRLNIPGENEFWGKGVSTCATCDAAFYREKVVAVAGGGDSAMEEASFLTKFASKVYLIHRRDSFKASKIMQERVLNNPKIEVLWNTEINEVVGDQKVTHLKISNSLDKKSTDLQVDGMFLAIGHIPNSSYLEGQLELDELGFVKATEHTKTNVDGVFVGGDVHDHHYKQAITASAMGCMAAIDAEKWLESNT